MGGSDELDLASNIGGCGVIGAVYGGAKAAWALAPTGEHPLSSFLSCLDLSACLRQRSHFHYHTTHLY